MENPQQFVGLDTELKSGLNLQPAKAEPLGERIDLSRIAAQHREARRQAGYVYKEGAAEYVLRKEWEVARQQEFAQQRAEYDARMAALAERQAQRNLELSRIPKGEQSPMAQPPRSDTPLSQMQRSTPERQPLPSPAEPPATLKGTAARPSAQIDPTVPPRPAILPKAIAATGAAVAAARVLPKSLPVPAGLVKGSAIVSALGFGIQVVQGRPVLDAGVSTAGTLAGTIIGGTLGSVLGPTGTLVGSVIGGYVGGQIAENILAASRPKAAQLTPENTYKEPPPFKGGQKQGATYLVSVATGITSSGYVNFYNPVSVVGPVLGVDPRAAVGNSQNLSVSPAVPPGDTRYGVAVIHNGGQSYYFIESQLASVAPYPGTFANRIAAITNVQGEASPDIDTPPVAYPPTPPSGNVHPGSREYSIPRGYPGAGENQDPPNRYVPPSTTPNPSPRGDSHNWVPHAGLAPRLNPNPTQTPSNLGGNLPFAEPKIAPKFALAPFPLQPEDEWLADLDAAQNQAFPAVMSGFVDGEFRDILDEGGILNLLPNGTKEASKLTTVEPDATKKIPSYKLTGTIPGDTNPEIDDIKKQQETSNKQIEDLGKLVASLIPLIAAIPANTANDPYFQQKAKDNVQGAVCEISQPQGCLGSQLSEIRQDAAAARNHSQTAENMLQALDTAGTGALVAGQTEILNRLGPPLPGGISTFLTDFLARFNKVAAWLHLDRVLNVLIWWQTLHNAYMLSSNLGQTLFSTLSNVLAAIGIKDAEGSPLDIGEIFGGQVDGIGKSIFGVSEWNGMKAEWKKWNRIYQATANLLNSIQSIGYSILSALEVVGSWVSSIGNALKKVGEVAENAYRWMNPTPNFQNRFFTALENVENVVSTIDVVASEVLSVQDTVTQITQQKAEFDAALKGEENSKQGTLAPEAEQIKVVETLSKTVSATGLEIAETDKEGDE